MKSIERTVTVDWLSEAEMTVDCGSVGCRKAGNEDETKVDAGPEEEFGINGVVWPESNLAEATCCCWCKADNILNWSMREDATDGFGRCCCCCCWCLVNADGFDTVKTTQRITNICYLSCYLSSKGKTTYMCSQTMLEQGDELHLGRIEEHFVWLARWYCTILLDKQMQKKK